MPNYYNPYNFYPATYPGAASYAQQPIMQAAQQSFNTVGQPKPWEWVDGEVGAIAYQMPPGWPANHPIQLWDSKDKIIWVKSWNQMGMPNPMQKIKYTIEEQPMLPQGQSGQAPRYDTESASNHNAEATSNFATKDDLETMKNEIKELLKSQNAGQNGGNNRNNNNGNRGGV